MGVRGLQSYILAKCPDSLIPIDLTGTSGGTKKRLIVIEGWSCLRSVYGPHMDFICGGQYQEFRASIRRFVNTFQQVANCELVVFFAGGVSQEERAEWARRKSHNRDTIGLVMQSLRQKGYSPDRKHFLPNETHIQVFRQVLLSCHVKVVSTAHSTGRAMLDYAHKNEAYGILANDSDFIMVNAPRYFSLHHLRISGNTISTMMIDRDKIAESLDLPLTLFPLLSCLLGNDIVSFELLEPFHSRLLAIVEEEDGEGKKKEVSDGLQLVGAVIAFVKELEPEVQADITGNISGILEKVLPEAEDKEELRALFIRGLEQYNEATTPSTAEVSDSSPTTVVTVTVTERSKPTPPITPSGGASCEEEEDEKEEKDGREEGVSEEEEGTEKTDTDGEVSELIEKVAEAKIVEEQEVEVEKEEEEEGVKEEEKREEDGEEEEEERDPPKTPTEPAAPSTPATAEEDGESEQGEPQIVTIPAVTGKVLRSAHAAHSSGTLNTQLYPLLSAGELSLGPIFEDPKDKDMPTSAQLYRAARQRIYGLLFGIGRASAKSYSRKPLGVKLDTERQVRIREYVVDGSRRNLLEHEDVPAIPVHSLNAKTPPRKPTPHIEKLWIGMSAKIQDLRRSTLCAIMNCKLPSFCTPNIIVNEYLLVCIVLRYILSSGSKVLREYELDAFLATALSPQLHYGPSFLYKITPGVRLTARGCTIAHLFVRGVETVLLANDACNYPIGLRFCFIGNFFDGKLFQQKLGQCRANMSLFEVCDGEPYAVEYMRYLKSVIMEELVPRTVFAPAVLPSPGPRMPRVVRPPPPPPPFHHMKGTDQNRGHSHRGGGGGYRGSYHPRGGGGGGHQYRPQGGAPNTGYHHHHHHHHHQNGNYQPQGRGAPYGGGQQQGGYPPNRRYPSNHYDHMENYADGGFHGNGYNNYPRNDAYLPNDAFPPYKPVDGGMSPSSGGGMYARGNYGGPPVYEGPKMGGMGGGPTGGYKESNPYGKRSIPDRRDTKSWINFLGN